MNLRIAILAILLTSTMLSCQKENAISANTGFFSFKERAFFRNDSTYGSWTFDSVEVYEPSPNKLYLRYIFDGSAEDSTKIVGNSIRLSSFSGFFPQFTIDPNTNMITAVQNVSPDTSYMRKAFLDTGSPSRYDAATRTYYLQFYMTQPARADLIFHDTLTALR